MSTNGSIAPTESPAPAPAATDDLQALAQRVDDAMADVQALPAEARDTGLALKTAIEQFHKAGLTRIVRTLKNDEHARQLLFDLLDEPSVYALFSMHGLVRPDLKTQVARTIELVRPYMQSHGGDIALVDVQDATVLVRLQGSCNGCSMAAQTLRNTVEESIRERVPEIEAVEVVADEPDNLVQLTPLPAAGVDHGWIEGPLVAELGGERPLAFDAAGVSVLLLPSRDGLRAYRNACAHQGLPLEGGLLDAAAGTITCPWHGFCFDSESGECFTAPQCQLEPFPLRIQQGRVFVRPE